MKEKPTKTKTMKKPQPTRKGRPLGSKNKPKNITAAERDVEKGVENAMRAAFLAKKKELESNNPYDLQKPATLADITVMELSLDRKIGEVTQRAVKGIHITHEGLELLRQKVEEKDEANWENLNWLGNKVDDLEGRFEKSEETVSDNKNSISSLYKKYEHLQNAGERIDKDLSKTLEHYTHVLRKWDVENKERTNQLEVDSEKKYKHLQSAGARLEADVEKKFNALSEAVEKLEQQLSPKSCALAPTEDSVDSGHHFAPYGDKLNAKMNRIWIKSDLDTLAGVNPQYTSCAEELKSKGWEEREVDSDTLAVLKEAIDSLDEQACAKNKAPRIETNIEPKGINIKDYDCPCANEDIERVFNNMEQYQKAMGKDIEKISKEKVIDRILERVKAKLEENLDLGKNTVKVEITFTND